MQQTLVVMAREPVLGRVKTRLARDIGHVAATGFYRRALTALVARLGADPRWRTVLAVAPDAAVTAPLARMRGAASVVAQGGGDLGARMQRMFDRAPPGPCVIVGSDIPDIGVTQVAAAFRALGAHEAVIGPTGDGGYWLIGQRRSPRILRCFEGVAWSSGRERAQTLANLRREGARVASLEVLEDIDTGADHAAWQARRRGRAAPRGAVPGHVRMSPDQRV